jgi:hypothetical protein
MKVLLRCALAITLGSLLVVAQESHRRPLPDIPPEGIHRPPPRVQIDPARLKREAEELAALAQSIPADMQKVGGGLLPKDLNEKLRKIEKLSKQLRKELSQ